MKTREIHERNIENVVQAKHSHGSSILTIYSIKGNGDGLQTRKGEEKDPFQRGLEVALLQARLELSQCTASTAPAVMWNCGLRIGHLLAAPTPQDGPVQKMGSAIPGIYPEPKSFLPALVKELNSGKRDRYHKEITRFMKSLPLQGDAVG